MSLRPSHRRTKSGSTQAGRLLLIPVVICTLGLLLFVSSQADASPKPQTATTPTPTFDVSRLAQPPTVYPPEQADNGAQTYWGMCIDCHGDRGQGLTDEWRTSFEPDERDCWASGCHGPDFPENSFEILETGVPAIVGAGKLISFANAFELQKFVRENMPLFPPGSLTEDEAWDVTAYILRLNDIQPADIVLDKTNSSAISIHHKVITPKSEIPGALALAGVLVLAAIGMGLQARSRSTTALPRPNFVHHLHPPSIPALQARFRYTLGAGGLAGKREPPAVPNHASRVGRRASRCDHARTGRMQPYKHRFPCRPVGGRPRGPTQSRCYTALQGDDVNRTR